jgi:hypothetical protein
MIFLFPPTLAVATVVWTATDGSLASPAAIRGTVLGVAAAFGYVLYRVAEGPTLEIFNDNVLKDRPSENDNGPNPGMKLVEVLRGASSRSASARPRR